MSVHSRKLKSIGTTMIFFLAHTTVIAPNSSWAAGPAGAVGAASNTGGATSASAAANEATGDALFPKGKGLLDNPYTVPVGMMLLTMAMQAFMQSGANSGVAGQAFNSAGGFNSAATYKPTGGTNASGGSPAQQDAISQLQADNLKAMNQLVSDLKNQKGIIADPNKGTLTLPDGTVLDGNSIATPEAAAKSLGISAKDYANALATAKSTAEKAMADLKLKGLVIDPGGGNRGTAVSSFEDPRSLNPKPAFQPAGSSLKNRGPANVAGLSKNYKGEPIGIAADSIFAMINRRYALKDKQNAFLNEGEVPTSGK